MGRRVETPMGTFLVFNRETDNCAEVGYLVDHVILGTGKFHYARAGNSVYLEGFETAEEAFDALDYYLSCIWNGYGV